MKFFPMFMPKDETPVERISCSRCGRDLVKDENIFAEVEPSGTGTFTCEGCWPNIEAVSDDGS